MGDFDLKLATFRESAQILARCHSFTFFLSRLCGVVVRQIFFDDLHFLSHFTGVLASILLNIRHDYVLDFYNRFHNILLFTRRVLMFSEKSLQVFELFLPTIFRKLTTFRLLKLQNN